MIHGCPFRVRTRGVRMTTRLGGLHFVGLLFVCAASGGCKDSTATMDMYVQDPLVRDRPYNLVVPQSYDPHRPAPLLVMLHGYTATGFLEEAYFNFTAVGEKHGFLYAIPDGTKNSKKAQFWNA